MKKKDSCVAFEPLFYLVQTAKEKNVNSQAESEKNELLLNNIRVVIQVWKRSKRSIFSGRAIKFVD